jgi:hypothetical protein
VSYLQPSGTTRRCTTSKEAKVHPQARVKKLAYLSRYLARKEGYDDNELGLERLSMRSLFASLDEKPFTSRITLQPNIVLEKSLQMSSQYLCGTARPSTSHVVHEVMVMDREGRKRAVKALIDCGASSFFISPKLVRYLGLREQTSPAYITTRGLDGKILARARDSRKLSLKMQYLPHLATVEEPEVLVVDMSAYDLVLGIPWFERHNPDIDWANKRLMALRKPKGSSVSGSVSNPVNSGIQNSVFT